jgi:hypothetical protein
MCALNVHVAPKNSITSFKGQNGGNNKDGVACWRGRTCRAFVDAVCTRVVEHSTGGFCQRCAYADYRGRRGCLLPPCVRLVAFVSRLRRMCPPNANHAHACWRRHHHDMMHLDLVLRVQRRVGQRLLKVRRMHTLQRFHTRHRQRQRPHQRSQSFPKPIGLRLND